MALRNHKKGGLSRDFWTRLFLGGVICLSACSDDVPEEYLIEDLRILNIKVEPPEIAIFLAPMAGSEDLLKGEFPSLDTNPITVTVLAAHPDLEASFSFDWIQCLPGFSSIPCEGTQRVRLDDSPSDILRFSPVKILLDGETQTTLGRGLTEDPLELLSGLRATVNVVVRVNKAKLEVDTPILEGKKRVVLFEPRLVAQTIILARQADRNQIPEIEGIELPNLCTRTSDAQVLALFDYLKNRKPNRGPVIEAIEISMFDQTDSSTRTVTSTDVVTLFAGSALNIEPILNEDVSEKFEVIDGNCELQEFEEEPAISWFVNRGVLTENRTKFDDAATIYRAPEAKDLGDEETMVRVFIVVRDGRGGSDHRHFNVKIVR